MQHNHHRHPRQAQSGVQPVASASETCRLPACESPELVPVGTSSVADTAASATSQAQAVLDRHLVNFSALLDRANVVATAMLDNMLTRIRRGDEVYPREFGNVVRGLHWLAKCGHELSRVVHGGRSGKTITQEQVAALEAKIMPLLGKAA